MKNTNSWYSDLYKRLEISTYISVIEKGLTVVKKTVGVGSQIIIKINTHFIKQDSPDRFYHRYVLIALRQAMGCGSEFISYIWHSCFCNHNTEMW